MPDEPTKVKKMFIASSSRRKPLVEAFVRELRLQAQIFEVKLEVLPWYRDVAEPGEDILSALTDHCRGNPGSEIAPSDFFAAFLTDDDLRDKGGAGGPAVSVPRDNVIFELGFFLGGLGFDMRRCFMLCSVPKTSLPSDLEGKTYIQVELPNGDSPSDYDQAVQGAAATVIRRIYKLGGVVR